MQSKWIKLRIIAGKKSERIIWVGLENQRKKILVIKEIN